MLADQEGLSVEVISDPARGVDEAEECSECRLFDDGEPANPRSGPTISAVPMPAAAFGARRCNELWIAESPL